MSARPEQFWMVYGLGQHAPTREHPSKESAEAEAKRLARLNPDIWFVVLEAISAVVKQDTISVSLRVSTRNIDDDIPF
jgi:hypothetical protein